MLRPLFSQNIKVFKRKGAKDQADKNGG